MIFQDKETIVFAGDSVTDCGRKRPYGQGLWEGLGNGYVRMVDSNLAIDYPDRFLHIINVGESGAASKDMLAHWEQNVEACHPDWVFFMIGANDVWRQFDEPNLDNSALMPDCYRANLESVCERTLPNVKGMFVISPFYMEANDNDPMKKRMVEYAKICQEVVEKYAKEYNIKYIDVQEDFDNHLKYRYPAYISWDRVHPNWVGGMIIARKILKAIEA